VALDILCRLYRAVPIDKKKQDWRSGLGPIRGREKNEHLPHEKKKTESCQFLASYGRRGKKTDSSRQESGNPCGKRERGDKEGWKQIVLWRTSPMRERERKFRNYSPARQKGERLGANRLTNAAQKGGNAIKASFVVPRTGEKKEGGAEKSFS